MDGPVLALSNRLLLNRQALPHRDDSHLTAYCPFLLRLPALVFRKLFSLLQVCDSSHSVPLLQARYVVLFVVCGRALDLGYMHFKRRGVS